MQKPGGVEASKASPRDARNLIFRVETLEPQSPVEGANEVGGRRSKFPLTMERRPTSFERGGR